MAEIKDNGAMRHCDVAVIGAGLTGLSLAKTLKKSNVDVLVFERDNRIGGQIHTFQEKGFVFESGPNTGVVSYPEVVELFDGLDCQLETACEAAKRRLIWKGNKFHELPCGFIPSITTPLFTLKDKIRILGEPFRKPGTNPNESVGELATRRLGKSFLDYAVNPFLSGVYAGDPMKLVTKYALPKLYNLEQDYGSFIKGAIAKSKIKKTPREMKASKKVFSAQGGMSKLVEALGRSLENHIILNAAHLSVQAKNGKWRICYIDEKQQQQIVECNKVVTTVGAYALPEMLPFVENETMQQISSLKYAPVMQVSVGLNNTYGKNFMAFGGLVPTSEHKPMLGILFPSSCFVHRAPEGGVVLSYFMGGVNHPELLTKTDSEIKSVVCETLVSMLGLPKGIEPTVFRVFRHKCAIPQYEKSSEQRFAAVECIQNQYSGLFIGGNLRDGIGMADRIRQAVALAQQIVEQK